MLKVRVITALVMVTAGLAAVFYLPPAVFSAFAAIVLLLAGGWEGARLAGIDPAPARWAFGVSLTAIGLAIYWLALEPAWLLSAGALLWLINLAWLSRPGAGSSGKPTVVVIKLVVLGGILIPAWMGLSLLQSLSPWLILLLVIMITAADIGAYFSGRHFGGVRLAPTISPGKTRAGALGGLFGAARATPIAAFFVPLSPFEPFMMAALAFSMALISIGGDLFVSLLKRQRQLKDTSSLLPGHGGLLDRFDSICAAVPFFALAVLHFSGIPLT